MSRIEKNWIYLIITISSIAILTAFIAEHLFKILPCKMCLYQRYPYYILILVSFIFLFLKNKNNKIYYILVEILLLIGIFFSLWHVAIENNLISGPPGCAISLENFDSNLSLKEYIINRPIVSCNEVNWTFLGISFAIYNSLLQIALLIINSIFMLKQRN